MIWQLAYITAVWALPAVLASAGLCYVIYQRFGSCLSSIPGPFLASLTDLWRLIVVEHGRFDLANKALHDKYGDLVRVGPNCISVADPREIRNIYGITRLFQKSEYYRVAQPVINGRRVASLFMITNEDQHKSAKRPIANAYAMTTLLDYEPYVDSTSKVLVAQLTKLYADTGKVCDFGEWLQWYAFDVIGEMTFSRRFGFLEQAKDVGEIIETLQASTKYTAVVGQMPWVDYLLAKNPLLKNPPMSKKKRGVSAFVMPFLQTRIDEADRARLGDEKFAKTERADFSSKFIAAFEKYHGNIPQSQLLGWSLSNINAGSDTTAITLRSIFHFLCLNPRCMSKLMEELESANISDLPTWREACTLPYLGAVIKEALRLHTPVGLILERIVPEGGVSLCGHFFPEGTIVGCNPAVIHKDERIYGRTYSVDEFWPERWLDAPEEERAEMERCFMAFGSGKRTCIGKNISLLEVHKLVPLLLMKFKLTLVDPKKKLTVWNTFFVHQKGLNVYVETA